MEGYVLVDYFLVVLIFSCNSRQKVTFSIGPNFL